MPNKGANRDIVVPAYTIRVPSGDHTGFNPGFPGKRIGAPPAAGILNNPGPEASIPPVTIHLPSGDQQGAPRTSMASVKVGIRHRPQRSRVAEAFPVFLERSPLSEPQVRLQGARQWPFSSLPDLRCLTILKTPKSIPRPVGRQIEEGSCAKRGASARSLRERNRLDVSFCRQPI